jgi:uncharacterized protein
MSPRFRYNSNHFNRYPVKTPVKTTKDGYTISLYVQPGASKTAWAGPMGEAVKLRVAAKPVEGEANKEVCRFLADWLRLPKSAVSIIQGASSRHKIVQIQARHDTELFKRIAAVLLDNHNPD